MCQTKRYHWRVCKSHIGDICKWGRCTMGASKAEASPVLLASAQTRVYRIQINEVLGKLWCIRLLHFTTFISSIFCYWSPIWELHVICDSHNGGSIAIAWSNTSVLVLQLYRYLDNCTRCDKIVCTVLFSSRWRVYWYELFSVLSTLQKWQNFDETPSL